MRIGYVLSVMVLILLPAVLLAALTTPRVVALCPKTPTIPSSARIFAEDDHWVYLPLIVKPLIPLYPDFTLAVVPTSRAIVQGQFVTYTLILTPLRGLTETVHLSVDDVPGGGQAGLEPASLTPAAGSVTFPALGTLSITTTAETYTGTHTLTVTGTGGTLQHTTPLTLSVAYLPVIALWQHFPLDPEYGGGWAVAGDLDGDGEVDIVSAENYNRDGVHYASAVVAQRLDGSVLWRWGDPSIGQKCLSYDVPVQIYDWDGDGTNEVILLTKEGDESLLVELDGSTGTEKRRFTIPPDATDSIVFADVSGNGRATDVLVKTRYTQIWAYTYEGDLLWTYTPGDKALTAHQPRPIDIDGDGRDEIMAGFSLLNADGSVRWTYASKGHLDAMRVLQAGATPEDFRLVITACGGNRLAVLDGNGQAMWEVSGYHFESVDIGHVCSQVPGSQIVVDVDHQPFLASPLWILDENGNRLADTLTYRSRHHRLIDWHGTGVQLSVVSEAIPPGLMDCDLDYVATFDLPPVESDAPANPECVEGVLPDSLFLVEVGDMTGNRIPDIFFHTSTAVYIFKNENGQPLDIPLGTGINVTLY